MSCNLPTGRNGLRSQNQMTRSTVFRIHLDREICSRHRCFAWPSDTVFAIVLLKNETLWLHVCPALRRCLNPRNAVDSKCHNGTENERTPSHALLSPLFPML